ncbi:hypothetical protein [Cyclobacterium marinum]|uniref:Nickel transport complex protein, NikM subunit, transmembrane n=1 Tax=Cyclobacterium marinum (strain ATCC 25205 / DSM 745 / LMG 13164 / NCIMB 1802) TaxID=880070 RepID=G0IVY5_CYCMS|nr:hypothetical protein [Cyclobacterium marinum]AEL25530.1 hypothetical protein Cycma_1777 [Cyclobacterium marinum DSM 745]
MKHISIKSLVLSLLLGLMASSVYAHALWIHTSSTAELGQTHSFKVYYADYHEDAIEDVADWYSDVEEFELWLISPSGKRSKLNKIARKDHFEGSFIADEKGEYQLQISHTAKVLKGTTAYQFNASAQVWAGKGKADLMEQTDLMLTRDPKSTKFNVSYKGQPLPEATINILSPDKNSQDLITGKKGKAKAEMKGSGKYFAEVTKTEKLEKDDPSGLKAIWRCATQVVDR